MPNDRIRHGDRCSPSSLRPKTRHVEWAGQQRDPIAGASKTTTMFRLYKGVMHMKLAIIGVPFNSAGTNTAEALAPAVLREAGLIEALSRGNDVDDYGDVEYDAAKSTSRDKESGIIAPKALLSMISAVRTAVTRAYGEGRIRVPVVVGGDCPLLLGGLRPRGPARRRPGTAFRRWARG